MKKKIYIFMISFITISIAFFAYNFFTNTKTQETDAAASRTGLVAHWDMDSNDINGTTIYDKSGNNNHVTMSGGGVGGAPTSTPGKIGQAIDFDGANGNIYKTTFSYFQNGMTVAGWFKRDGGEEAGSIFSGSLGNDPAWNLGFNNSTSIKFTYYSGATGLQDIATTGIINSDEWYFVVLTRNDTDFELFVNGISKGTRTTAINTTVNNFGIARHAGAGINNWGFFDGSIDDVRIYDYALSAQEVANLYNSAKTNYTQAPTRKGLIGHWDMDSNDINGTTVYDKSGQNNNGIFTDGGSSPTSTQGKIAQAIGFTNNTDYINVGDKALFRFTENTPFTISTWFNTSFAEYTNSSGYIFYKRSGNDRYTMVVTTNGKLNIQISDGLSLLNVDSLDSVDDGLWHHGVLYYDGANELRLYVDNILQGSDTDPVLSGVDTSGNAFSIGGYSSYPSESNRFFQGDIDDVRIYDYALSAEEISNLYNSAKTNYTQAPSRTGLVGYWTLDEEDINGTTVLDKSGQKNNGTSANTPTVVAGKIGQAMSFNGTSDAIEVKNSNLVATNSASTVVAWIKAEQENTFRTIYSENITAGVVYLLRINTSGFLEGYRYLPSNMLVAGDTRIDDGKWHQVVLTFDTTNGTIIYLDGEQENINIITTVVSGPIVKVRIGRNTNIGSEGWFDGDIDDVRLYDYALSAEEVAGLYSSSRKTYMK